MAAPGAGPDLLRGEHEGFGLAHVWGDTWYFLQDKDLRPWFLDDVTS